MFAISKKGLQELPPPRVKYGWWAKIVSVLLHPLFIPVFVVAFLLYIHPGMFTGFSNGEKMRTLLITAINLVGYPLVAVLLLKALGFIGSIQMYSSRDRIIPYIACGIFFFWTYQVFREQPQYPRELVSFIFGVFLASSLALLANIYLKVSMHAIGMGGLISFFLLLSFNNSMLMTWPLALAFIVAGLALTARLFLQAHAVKEIFAGFVIGMLSQLIAWWVVL